MSGNIYLSSIIHSQSLMVKISRSYYLIVSNRLRNVMMELKNIYNSTIIIWKDKIKVLKIILSIALLIGFGFFVKEVFIKWTSKDTNFKQSKKFIKSVKSPTTTLCFNPPLIKSVRNTYKLPRTVIQNFVWREKSNDSIYLLFNASSYWLGQDFHLKFFENYKANNLTEGKNIINGNEKRLIYVQKIHSDISGLCYKIVPDFNTDIGKPHTINMRIGTYLGS